MEVKGIGWRTDLRLRELEGARVTRGDGHCVVETPDNRGYRWGNFLLFSSPPQPGEPAQWLALFEATFPHARYVAMGIDSPAGESGAADQLSAAGIRTQRTSVLTATTLRRPTPTPPEVTLRPLKSDEDWRLAVEMHLVSDEDAGTPADDAHRDYSERRMRVARRVCEEGRGAWYGAFWDEEMVAGLGIFNGAPGVARFQSVDTHPLHRREGLARNLVFVAGEWAKQHLGARELVIAADPDYFAIDIYRSLGFQQVERQVQLERVNK
jgi:GNAT superfamily N-acetyltransferase